MNCKNCGEALAEGVTVCPKCNTPVEEADKIQITYEDESTEAVEAPVITESHTFIEEEDFAKKINDQFHTTVVLKNGEEVVEDDYDLEEGEDSKKGPIVWILMVILLLIIGGILYFAVVPNILVTKEKRVSTDQPVQGFTSEEWTTKEFKIDGVFYQLNEDYSAFANHGWSYSIEDEIKVEAGDKTDSDIVLSSSSYKNNHVLVGFFNSASKDATVKDCKVYAVTVDNYGQDKPIDFELPGGIKMGSGALEITSIYGKVTEENIKEDTKAGYSIYHYEEGNLSLDLTIYEEDGLQKFSFMQR